MKFVLLGLLATAAAASNDQTVGLRGYTRKGNGAARHRWAMEYPIADIVEKVLRQDGDAAWTLIEVKNDGTDITLTYELGGEGGRQDGDFIDIVSVTLSGNDEKILLAGLLDEKPHTGNDGRDSNKNHQKSKGGPGQSMVKSVKKGKKKQGKKHDDVGVGGGRLGDASDVTTEAPPATTTEAPAATTETPDATTVAPDTTTKAPVTTAETPAEPESNPVVLGGVRCPAHYDNSKTYVEGDTIENDLHIYECKAHPYEEYCSIAEPDGSWDEVVKELWKDAWAHVGACDKLVDGTSLAEDDAGAGATTEAPAATTTDAAATEAPAATTEASAEATNAPAATTETPAATTGAPVGNAGAPDVTTDAPAAVTEAPATTEEALEEATEAPVTTAVASEAPIATTTTRPPLCPSAYDPNWTNYAAGDQITVKCDIFQCRDADHEAYCNIAAWDDSLLAANADAKELWVNAWEMLGKCEPTQAELMEEEAESVAWDCLAAVEAQPASTAEEETPSVAQATPSPTPSPTEPPTPEPIVATTTTVAATEAAAATTAAKSGKPQCPPAYNPSKTTYVVGDEITVKCSIFKCRDADHEVYCNLAAWDDALSVDNPNAKGMWMEAWEEVESCEPTQSEVMGEEAINGESVEWDCLA